MPRSRRTSLVVKIPLLMSTLLLLALAGMSAASYVELRGSLIETATGRLQRAAEQMANVFSLSARQRVTALQQLMDKPEVHAYLRTRDAGLETLLRQDIEAYLGTTIAVANVELWDADGERLFASGAEFERITGQTREEFKQVFSGAEPAIGKLRQFPDGLRYPVGGQVSEGGHVLGFVVERRRISNPAQTIQVVALLTGLIGNEATMVIGNTDGSAWSNLETAITDLPIRGTDARLWEYRRANRPPVLAWATPIAQSQWTVAIEFPLDVVLQPSQRFLMRSAAIAGGLLLVVGAVAWFTSRRITGPLVQVTEAAEAVAESKPHVHVDVNREDEIGRLADSFNTMAAKVELARADLELRVETRTSELRAANRELEAFSYSVSHDLRAPLRAIVGFVQILEEDHAAALDATARHHLERVRLNARRMGQLIDDLLSFSQIGRTTMVRQAIDMQALATSVAHDAIAASGRTIDLAIEALPPAYGEAALINQVLVNLVSNAVKFTAKAAQPSIAIGARDGDGETTYFVRDNGVGFDQRYVEKLFGVFQRLHRADEFEGTGVGLAIVHRVVSRHGGRVWAEGRVDGGATFYFTLPPARPETKPA